MSTLQKDKAGEPVEEATVSFKRVKVTEHEVKEDSESHYKFLTLTQLEAKPL